MSSGTRLEVVADEGTSSPIALSEGPAEKGFAAAEKNKTGAAAEGILPAMHLRRLEFQVGPSLPLVLRPAFHQILGLGCLNSPMTEEGPTLPNRSLRGRCPLE